MKKRIKVPNNLIPNIYYVHYAPSIKFYIIKLKIYHFI